MLYFVFLGLSGLVGLGSFICWVVILIHAFKESVLQGLLCFLCFPYMAYYGFAKFQHERKWLVLVGWLGGLVLAGLINWLGGLFFAPEVETPEFDESFQTH